ncbi:DUF4175 domain-containing protein [Marinobacter sp. F4206]|uniref:DUF4175 domain-containing protein n=1 Tax=Marinobacter sp. F4206 TaxID=2861777 RepID=UPI001C5FC419|nr:DUF4175 domain-containing protein [Marinobacter sp. F4206]MBW4934306.1 DUF4175 domain-containing protein [Marinobacter sp. F4206]
MVTIKKIVAVGVLAAAPVWAFAHGSEGPYSGHGPGMMMSPEQMEQMHRNWSRMDGMMQQVPEASSPAERQRLMEEHWEAMEEQMELMHQGMMGPGMMGPGMMGNSQGMMNNQGQKQSGNAQGNGAGTANMDYGQRMEMMERRMDQMQIMMEQMFKHQQQLNRN